MKAIFVEDKQLIKIKSKRMPSIQSDEVLIKVAKAGICGSDIHAYNGNHPFRKPPVSIGHELSGTVVDAGSDVDNIPIGANVTVLPQRGCGHCRYCEAGIINLCENRKAPGTGDWGGAMASYFTAHYSTVKRLPENVSLDAGVLTEPLSVGFHAIEKADLEKRDKVAILGGGPIGLVTLLASLSKGIKCSLVTDVRSYPLEAAKNLGAHHILNITQCDNWVDQAMNIVGGEFDKVIITTDAPGIVNHALQLVKRGGKVITVAMFNTEQTIDVTDLQGTEKEVIGCMTYSEKNFNEALDLLGKKNQGKIMTDNIISHFLPFNEAENGFQMLKQHKDNVLKVVLDM